MNKKLLGAVVMSAMGASVSGTASAALAADAVLNFTPGVVTQNSSGTDIVRTGSYFGLDTSGDGVIRPPERVPLSQNNGLILGTSQAASGSHGGPIDGTESPGIDNPWEFGGSTGMQYSSSPTNLLSATGNSATIDFSGWGVTWNGIPAINMGGGSQDCGATDDGICVTSANVDIGGVFDNGTGIASITCAVDCAEGDAFTLDYDAVVPQADPSNFGGVAFTLHLVGTIGAQAPVSAVPVPAAVWLFGSGLVGLAGIARRRKSA